MPLNENPSERNIKYTGTAAGIYVDPEGNYYVRANVSTNRDAQFKEMRDVRNEALRQRDEMQRERDRLQSIVDSDTALMGSASTQIANLQQEVDAFKNDPVKAAGNYWFQHDMQVCSGQVWREYQSLKTERETVNTQYRQTKDEYAEFRKFAGKYVSDMFFTKLADKQRKSFMTPNEMREMREREGLLRVTPTFQSCTTDEIRAYTNGQWYTYFNDFRTALNNAADTMERAADNLAEHVKIANKTDEKWITFADGMKAFRRIDVTTDVREGQNVLREFYNMCVSIFNPKG